MNIVSNKKLVHGAIARVDTGDFSWSGAAGNLSLQTPFFIASTTKLYVTACFFILKNQGTLSLANTIGKYLDDTILHGLHLYRGKDFSRAITVAHLLSQTSGLPDYFMGKEPGRKPLLEDIEAGRDRHWSFDETIEVAKKIGPAFAPGEKTKALYSDTNFQILGKILEAQLNKPLATIFDELIFKPLKLNSTYLYCDPGDTKPASLYFKNDMLKIPRAMSSFQADGGIVSTVDELMIFLKAFFQGTLFKAGDVKQMMKFRRIFFPLEYGVGISRFKLPRIFSPFKPTPEFIGHSGLSGAFAFYCPGREAWFTGTVNQVHKPGISFKLMLQLLNSL